ncbi:MAG: flagellar export chaperone FliS [Armatimonadetes bacterium]|nr:flagellar export chaperone FliS [Armatimonadota bacterium]
MEAGKHAMQSGDIYAQNENVQKAQRIIAELMATLDMEQGGEVAGNLSSLYSYIYNRLVEANMDDRPEHIDECVRLLRDLRESRAELETESKAHDGQAKEAGDAA